MYAFDARTGKVLWQTRLPTTAQGFPSPMLPRGGNTSRCRPAWRRQLVDADRAGAASGHPAAARRQLAAGVRAARVTAHRSAVPRSLREAKRRVRIGSRTRYYQYSVVRDNANQASVCSRIQLEQSRRNQA